VLKIDVGLFNKGQFPITGIDSFNISVSGKAFGGEFEGQLIAGILKLSSDYRPISSTDTTTVVVVLGCDLQPTRRAGHVRRQWLRRCAAGARRQRAGAWRHVHARPE
jgi:hypothetical protein